jgi:hypothetical protein
MVETRNDHPLSAATMFGLLGVLVLSLLAAIWVAAELAYLGGSQGSQGFIAIEAIAAASFAVFDATYPHARGGHTFNTAALAVLAFTVLLGPIGVDLYGRPSSDMAREYGWQYLSLVPALIAIVIQWRLVRWRWLAAHGVSEASRWPWITTIAGTMFMLGPAELHELNEAIRGWGYFPEITTAVILGEILILIVLGVFEASIMWWLSRQLKPPKTPPGP